MREQRGQPTNTNKAPLAVLTGNGASIGFNQLLGLDLITTEVLDRIAGGNFEESEIRDALQELADLVTPNGQAVASDFERLVGTFDGDFLKIEKLRILARSYSSNYAEVTTAIDQLQNFADEIKRRAISHILEVILERSRSNKDADNLHHLFVKNIIDSFKGQIVFGNLNYDTLLLSSLTHNVKFEFADMADGQEKSKISWKAGPFTFIGSRLRESIEDFPDFRQRRIRLVHLHGSLTYWSDEKQSLAFKINASDLASIDQWKAMREGTNRAHPLVVLTNQDSKSEKVQRYPFSLAYEVFEQGLKSSNHWLIVGYSFKDEVANKLLYRIYRSKDVKPKVLIVTKGAVPSKNKIKTVFGLSSANLRNFEFFREGVENLTHSDAWQDFSSTEQVFNKFRNEIQDVDTDKMSHS